MFSNSKFMKKFVMSIIGFISALFTVFGVLAVIFIKEREALYLIVPFVLIYDIIWALYFFYFSKKGGDSTATYSVTLSGNELVYFFFHKKSCPICGKKMKREKNIESLNEGVSSVHLGQYYAGKRNKVTLYYRCLCCKKIWSIKELADKKSLFVSVNIDGVKKTRRRQGDGSAVLTADTPDAIYYSIGGISMPREARKKSENGTYHVMLRGINRQTIFEDDEDCEKYFQCIAECKEASHFSLYAYCLMGNHIHLLLKEEKEPLELIFKRIGARYVSGTIGNKRSGHLFQDRFRSEPIKDDAHFLAVLRYIYQNPIKANICKLPEEYEWSSYRSLGTDAPLVDQNWLFKLISIEQLHSFIETPTDDQFLDLVPDLRITDRDAVKMVKKICRITSLSEFQTLPPENQVAGLRNLHEKGCSIRQLVRLTGIAKSQIERALKQEISQTKYNERPILLYPIILSLEYPC